MVAALKAAAEPTRLRILLLLAGTELSVKDLTRILGQSQPRISRHLKLLHEAGLIERSREGSWVYFTLGSSMSGGAISAQSAIVRFNSNLVVSGANTFTGSNDIFLQGVVSGTGGIIKSGISNLVLAGSNTFTGGLTVNSGVVTLSNAGALNVAGVNFVTNNGGTIHLNGNNVTIAGLRKPGWQQSKCASIKRASAKRYWLATTQRAASAA